MNAIGLVLKYLWPGSGYIWPVYTLLMTVGWGIYSTCQLLVLYSRLHLVCQSHRLQRSVLYIIIASVFLIVIPTWVIVWPAFNTDPKINSAWSPRNAVVDRYNQMAHMITECIVSGLYISSILKLLRLKSSVRQRRVLRDLFSVNIIAITFDILTVLLVHLNKLGLSHPIQTFGYILKLRLEFFILNQLMAVAARGLHRETFEEKRYHYLPTHDEDWPSKSGHTPKDARRVNTGDSNRFGLSAKHIESRRITDRTDPPKVSLHMSIPSPIMLRPYQRNSHSGSDNRGNFCPRTASNPSKEGSYTFRPDHISSEEALRPPDDSSLTSKERGSNLRRSSKSIRVRREAGKDKKQEDDDDDEIPLHA